MLVEHGLKTFAVRWLVIAPYAGAISLGQRPMFPNPE
jgi:hypothetical protein